MAIFLDQLREEGAGVYPALLFLPENIREDVAVLHAFHLETGNIAYRVSEPLPGEIRLQWWRDVLAPSGEASRTDEAAANPLADSLCDVISRHKLSPEGFDRYLEARVFDLYNDAFPDRTALEAYLGETDSFVLQMTCQIAGFTMSREFADACGHSGVAIGIGRRLGLMPHDRANERTFLPLDLLLSAGLDRESWLSGTDERHHMAITAFQALGREHAGKAASAIGKLPKEARSLFLPLALQRVALNRKIEPETVLQKGLQPSPIRQQLALLKAAFFGF